MNVIDKLPPDALELQAQIESSARNLGLSFDPIIYSMKNKQGIAALMARDGLPERIPDWERGMIYEELIRRDSFEFTDLMGVIALGNPSYGFIINTDAAAQRSAILACHTASADFFKRNKFFSKTTKNIVQLAADNRATVQKYIQRHGISEVESFIDAVKSLENLIDIHEGLVLRPDKDIDTKRFKSMTTEEYVNHKLGLIQNHSASYMGAYLNPEEFVAAEKIRLREEHARMKDASNFPLTPKRDVLGFLVQHAEAEPWQTDIIQMFRDESIYFAPFRRTQMMRLGWSVYWQKKILFGEDPSNMFEVESIGKGLVTIENVVDFGMINAQILEIKSNSINPHKLGYELWKDIEDRWNRGKHGKVYNECNEMSILDAWDEYVVFHNIVTSAHDDFEIRQNWGKYLAFAMWHSEESKNSVASSNNAFTLREYHPAHVWHRVFDSFSERPFTESNIVTEKIRREIQDFESLYSMVYDDTLTLTEMNVRWQEFLSLKRFKRSRIFETRNSELAFKDSPTLWGLYQQYKNARIAGEESGIEDVLEKEFALHYEAQGSILSNGETINPLWYGHAMDHPQRIPVGVGRQKIFNVAQGSNDVGFIYHYITQEFVDAQRLFGFEKNRYVRGFASQWKISKSNVKKIKERLLRDLINYGNPQIEVTHGNLSNQRELMLHHAYNGVPLHPGETVETLKCLHRIWGRPVNLHTHKKHEGKVRPCVVRWDGANATTIYAVEKIFEKKG